MSEFRFRIDAYTPETLPMERLAEYLADLATMLGTPDAVHFVRLDRGSVIPVINVEPEALPKVRARIQSVKEGAAPRDALYAYQAINARLLKDNGVGTIVDVENEGAEIIRFPGREAPQASYGAVRKQGTLDGEVIRVGGVNRTRVPIALQIEDRVISYVHAKKSLAQEIGNRLYRPVRLFGVGRWRRDPIGIWEIEDFSVDRFEPLKADGLSSALTALRAVSGGEWATGSLEELQNIRQGEDE